MLGEVSPDRGGCEVLTVTWRQAAKRESAFQPSGWSEFELEVVLGGLGGERASAFGLERGLVQGRRHVLESLGSGGSEVPRRWRSGFRGDETQERISLYCVETRSSANGLVGGSRLRGR